MSPKLIDRKTLRGMRKGSALVDVGIDQGGIAETSRPTSHSAPTYVEEGVVHYCVPNMPAACARTASLALERAVLPFVLMIMKSEMNADLATGIQVKDGKVTHEHLARDTGRAYFSL
jgi:alanine dehydrogenase